MNNIMIIGGSSGIGRELAFKFASQGHHVMVTGRNEERLLQVQEKYPEHIDAAILDINRLDSPLILNRLLCDFGPVDVLILSAGGGDRNPELDWGLEDSTITLNVRAFARTIQWAYGMMLYQGHGQLVGITSVAGLRGFRHAPAYSAAKSFQIRYLEALRVKSQKARANIRITDIRPGFIGKGQLASSYPKTAGQIYRAIINKRQVAYVTQRWILPAAILRIVPERVLMWL